MTKRLRRTKQSNNSLEQINGSVCLVSGKSQGGSPSLGPYLQLSRGTASYMDAALMKPEDAACCRWVGYNFGKGVTSPNRDLSVFGVPAKEGSGWHAELVRGFPFVDTSPLCYQPDHVLGFDDFVRWVYFVAPTPRESDVFGVDFSVIERPTAGVADSVVRLYRTAVAALRHGVPGDAELALLNTRMIEEPAVSVFKTGLNLVTVSDWAERGPVVFSPSGNRCLKCGMESRYAQFRFCFRCGEQFAF